MARQPCRRARRVSGVPQGVVAWIDHDRQDDLLFLNADRYTAEEEEAITAVLATGRYTRGQALDAFVTRGG